MNAIKIWIGYKVNLLLTQKWEENIPKFYFCIRDPTFSTHIPCPLKMCFTNKVNLWWGSLASPRVPLPASRVSGSHVSGAQAPRSIVPVQESQSPRVPSLRVPESQGPRILGPRVLDFRVPGLRVSGLRVPGAGSQVLTLGYANIKPSRASKIFLGV